MNLKNLIENYAECNLNANRQFVTWLKAKSDEQLLQSVASSFPSILQTLNHIWAIEEIWCCDLFKNEDFVNRYGAEHLQSAEIFDGLLLRSEKISEKVAVLTEVNLAEKLHIEKPWFTANLSLGEYLLHLFNHSTYHRGQIVTMAHQLGFSSVPSTDFLFYSIMQSNK